MTITTEFLDEMISAQELLEKMGALPKWLKTISADETTVAGDILLTNLPPADFIRVYDDQALEYLTSDGNYKRAIRLDTRNQLVSKRNAFSALSSQDSVADDIWWYLDRTAGVKQIEITPTQTRDVDFHLTYYAAETVLTGSNDNQWCTFEPDLISGMAGMELATWLRDDRALQKFTGQAQTARRILINQIESDEWGDMDLTMGGPD
jgi:hypothetical protein